MPKEKVVVDFRFREKLNKITGGKHHNYCYQCSACVAVCPAARFTDEFNPRIILLKALLGMEEALIGEDSPIWLCTNCYSCYERCPQDVRPIEVIIALKNLAVERETAPANLAKLSENIAETGMSVTVSSAVNRRRQELGLPPLKTIPLEELKKILEEDEAEEPSSKKRKGEP
ncbi:MAG: 4Fe-4S dicluster domain-containing protein [candidate division WOR-3 bacterium]|nr:MAG: 4Fe-4S dicluster domain-containing protein [candidate division WOR-3 bacterium]